MTVASIPVEIPQSLYQRLEWAAHRLQKPVEHLLVETLQATLPEREEIPEDIQAEVADLAQWDSSALQDVAVSQMVETDQQILEHLLDMQSIRPLSVEEQKQLELLRIEYGRILLRKARALALLVERGHPYDRLFGHNVG